MPNYSKIGPVVSEENPVQDIITDTHTDRHTHRQADYSIPPPLHFVAGGYNKIPYTAIILCY